jgi:hypothetical protein
LNFRFYFDRIINIWALVGSNRIKILLNNNGVKHTFHFKFETKEDFVKFFEQYKQLPLNDYKQDADTISNDIRAIELSQTKLNQTHLTEDFFNDISGFFYEATKDMGTKANIIVEFNNFAKCKFGQITNCLNSLTGKLDNFLGRTTS